MWKSLIILVIQGLILYPRCSISSREVGFAWEDLFLHHHVMVSFYSPPNHRRSYVDRLIWRFPKSSYKPSWPSKLTSAIIPLDQNRKVRIEDDNYVTCLIWYLLQNGGNSLILNTNFYFSTSIWKLNSFQWIRLTGNIRQEGISQRV